MSILENTLTWIGNNKLASFLSLLCFILFISTIAMGVQKGEWEERAKVCERKLQPSTPVPSSTVASSTGASSTDASSTETPTTEPSSIGPTTPTTTVNPGL